MASQRELKPGEQCYWYSARAVDAPKLWATGFCFGTSVEAAARDALASALRSPLFAGWSGEAVVGLQLDGGPVESVTVASKDAAVVQA